MTIANTYFDGYGTKHPDIIIKILEYFNITNPCENQIKEKSVLHFCEQFKDSEGHYIYQPKIVSRICKRLCECGQMECLKSAGLLGMNDNYMCLLQDVGVFKAKSGRMMYYFNSMVYGFEYIYNMYKGIVVPLVCEIGNGDYAAGTGFKYLDGIVTAKHCVKDVANLQIKGYKAEELEGKPVYISDIDGVDLAFIETGRVEEPLIYADDGEVMQEVLVMGYPQIPAFTNFLTAEKALISSKASSRLTPTKGAISAFGFQFLTKFDAMLITARIRGGNSGGPVINQNGCLVGIACQILDSDPQNGNYDDLGYGVAVPVSYLRDIVERKPAQLSIPSNFYRDFIE